MHPVFDETLMNIDSPVVPRTKRIAGTLHKRGYVDPGLVRDESLPRERAEESEVSGRHQDSERKDLDNAR